jgi:phosphatidylglycerophosphatase A
MTRLITTFFYAGLLRPAPGTWGSLAALPAGLVIYLIGGPWTVLIVTVGAYFLGRWAVAVETAGAEDKDPGHIVIDEVVGQWIALLPVFFGAAHAGAEVTALYPGWIAAFLLFRLFDIWKPGPVGKADRKGGPTGVMLDDVWAGVFAALGVILLAALSHLVIMQ